MKTILITGSEGQLGQELKLIADKHKTFQFIFKDRLSLDITKSELVNFFFNSQKIDFCINAAAYTAVDHAEKEQQLSYEINAIGVKNIAISCQQYLTKLIHISTDFVFDGSKNIPYTEDNVPNPLGIYGSTKLSGEKMAMSFNNHTIIIRTSWLYSNFGNNFLKTIQRLAREKKSINVVYDQVGSPTYAKDLAAVILQIINKWDENTKSTIYHFSNEGVASWYDFAQAIMEISNLKCKVYPITTNEYPTLATRPKFSVLNKKKIKDSFGITIPYWLDSLKECLSLQKNEIVFPK